MSEDQIMPNALQVAEAMAKVLSARLADFQAEKIVLDRDEATLCLGLVNGVIEMIETEATHGS